MTPQRKYYWKLKAAAFGAASIVGVAVIAPVVADDGAGGATRAIDLRTEQPRSVAVAATTTTSAPPPAAAQQANVQSALSQAERLAKQARRAEARREARPRRGPTRGPSRGPSRGPRRGAPGGPPAGDRR